MALTYRRKIEKAHAKARAGPNKAMQDLDWIDFYAYKWVGKPEKSGLSLGRAKARRAAKSLCAELSERAPGWLGAPLFACCLGLALVAKSANLAVRGVLLLVFGAIALPIMASMALGMAILRPREVGMALWAAALRDKALRKKTMERLDKEFDVVAACPGWLSSSWVRFGGPWLLEWAARAKDVVSARLACWRNDGRLWVGVEARVAMAWLLPFELLARAWLADPERAPSGYVWMLLGASPAPAICSALRVCAWGSNDFSLAPFERRGLELHFRSGFCGCVDKRYVVPAFRDERLAMDLSSIWGAFAALANVDRDALGSPIEDVESAFVTESPWWTEREKSLRREGEHWRAWALALPRIRSERGEIMAAMGDGRASSLARAPARRL